MLRSILITAVLLPIAAAEPPARVRIVGLVVDASKKPIDVAVRVQVFAPDGRRLVTTFSDVHGRFLIELREPAPSIVVTFTRNDSEGPQTVRIVAATRDTGLGQVTVPE